MTGLWFRVRGGRGLEAPSTSTTAALEGAGVAVWDLIYIRNLLLFLEGLRSYRGLVKVTGSYSFHSSRGNVFGETGKRGNWLLIFF